MSRYIVGTVTAFGELFQICWDPLRARLDAAELTIKPYIAGPEASAYTRALIEQELEAGMHQLNKLDGYDLTLEHSVPVWLRHRHERAIAERLVADCIAQGYELSVCDGEEWTVKRSTDAKQVMDALFSTGEDFLRLFKGVEKIGQFTLISGNDGWDLIADWSYTEETAELMRRAQKGAEDMASAIENKYGA